MTFSANVCSALSKLEQLGRLIAPRRDQRRASSSNIGRPWPISILEGLSETVGYWLDVSSISDSTLACTRYFPLFLPFAWIHASGIIQLCTQATEEALRRSSRQHKEKLFIALADVETLHAMHEKPRCETNVALTASPPLLVVSTLSVRALAVRLVEIQDDVHCEDGEEIALPLRTALFPSTRRFLHGGAGMFIVAP